MSGSAGRPAWGGPVTCAARLVGAGELRQGPAWARPDIETVGPAQADAFESGPGDHDGVVGAEADRRGDEGDAACGGGFGEGGADRSVGGDAAGDDKEPGFWHGGHRV